MVGGFLDRRVLQDLRGECRGLAVAVVYAAVVGLRVVVVGGGGYGGVTAGRVAV